MARLLGVSPSTMERTKKKLKGMRGSNGDKERTEKIKVGMKKQANVRENVGRVTRSASTSKWFRWIYVLYLLFDVNIYFDN